MKVNFEDRCGFRISRIIFNFYGARKNGLPLLTHIIVEFFARSSHYCMLLTPKTALSPKNSYNPWHIARYWTDCVTTAFPPTLWFSFLSQFFIFTVSSSSLTQTGVGINAFLILCPSVLFTISHSRTRLPVLSNIPTDLQLFSPVWILFFRAKKPRRACALDLFQIITTELCLFLPQFIN